MLKAIIIANVIVHLAGINVVSDSIPGDCGVKIIMPRIHYVSQLHGTQERAANPAKTQPVSHHGETMSVMRAGDAQPLGETKHIQDHESLLLFRTSSYLTAVNWTKVDLSDGWSYVKLAGDHVRFKANVSDDPADLTNVKLPRVKQDLCPVLVGLKPGYQPPYQGASAVFDLPEGKLKSCRAGTRTGSGRLDTELTLKSNAGVFIVSASTMTQTKELRLRVLAGADLELIAANVPATYLQGNYTTPSPTSLDGVPHYRAYYDMATGPSASCTTSITQWLDSSATDPEPCQMLTLADVAGKVTTKGTVFTLGEAANFECSNSQWP